MLAFYGIVFVLFPILSTPLGLLGLLIDKKNNKFYIMGLVFNIAIIGYYFVPAVSDDLYRHFENMSLLRLMSLKDIFLMYSTDPLVLKNFWFFLVSLTNNYSLLSFSAIFISYFIVLRDIYIFGIKEKLPSGLILSCMLLVFAWWQLIWTMSGVRYPVAIALFFHALFREFIEGKKDWKTYILYIIPMFLHNSVFVLIVLRIGLLFFNKFKVISVIILLFWGMVSNFVLILLTLINIPYISSVAAKAELYLVDMNVDNFYLANNAFKLLFSIIFILAFIYLKRTQSEIFIKYQNFYLFGLTITLFCLGGSNIYIILERFGVFVLLMLPVILMPIVNNGKNKLLISISFLPYILLLIIGCYFQYIPLKSTRYEITFFELISKNVIDLLIK